MCSEALCGAIDCVPVGVEETERAGGKPAEALARSPMAHGRGGHITGSGPHGRISTAAPEVVPLAVEVEAAVLPASSARDASVRGV
jgi:hypothetical protein